MAKIAATERKSEFCWQVLASSKPLDLGKTEFFSTLPIPSWIASEGLMGKDQKYDPDHITAPEDSVTDKSKNQSSSVVLAVLD